MAKNATAHKIYCFFYRFEWYKSCHIRKGGFGSFLK